MKGKNQIQMSAAKLNDEAQETAQVDPNRWRALFIILLAPFLSVLDFFIVNISIPSIQTGLHATFAEVQLVIAGYGRTYAADDVVHLYGGLGQLPTGPSLGEKVVHGINYQ